MMEVATAPSVAQEIKKEDPESCTVCGGAGAASALAGPAAELLARHAPVLAGCTGTPRACTSCALILAALERAETEYVRHKAAFDAVLARNPLLTRVKLEPDSPTCPSPPPPLYGADSGNSSEDEPLAVTKQKRNGNKKDKKASAADKKTRKSSKRNNKDSTDNWNLATQIVAQLTSAPVKEEAPFGSDPALPSLYEVKLEFEEGDSFPVHDPDFEGDFGMKTRGRGARGRGQARGRGRGRPRGARGGASKEPKEVHQCDLCSNKYTSLKRLEQHREKHEKGPFICEVCGARYKHKRACDIHVALHRGISDWKCLECDKLFPSRGALQRHNNIHTGTPCYQCDQCGKSFIHTSSFKMHKLSHSGLKAHACAICGLKLMTRSHLKRHARVHSGEKRHECALCGKRFSERYNLAAHSRAHIAAGDPPPLATGGAPPPRRRLFRCLYCADRFERRYMLERHTAVAHGRTLERAPPTPRNTMSKLLKAQAMGGTARAQPTHADDRDRDVKPTDKSPSNPSPATAPTTTESASWTGGFHEVPLRPFQQPQPN